MIFAYFNRNYELKEIITENSPRTGSSDIDHIYVYVDFAEVPTISSISAQFLRQGLSLPITPSPAPSTTRVGLELPNDPLRNLSYFSYDHTYEDATGTHIGYQFFDFPIPNDLYDGISPTSTDSFLAQLIAVFNISGNLYSLDVLPFTVKVTGIVLDGSINLSQYKYLLSLLSVGMSVKFVNNIASVAESTAWSQIPNDTILFDVADNIIYKKLSDSGTKYQIQANFQEKYNLNNVRYYSSLEDYTTDLTHLANGQLSVIKDSTNTKFVIKDTSESSGYAYLTNYISSRAVADESGNNIKASYASKIDVGFIAASNYMNLYFTLKNKNDTSLNTKTLILFSATTSTAGLMSASDKVKLDQLTGVPLIYKGSVNTYADLPTLETEPTMTTGWLYNVLDTGENYASVVTAGVLTWDKFGGDLSQFLKKDGSVAMTGDLNLDSHDIDNANEVNATTLNVGTISNNGAIDVMADLDMGSSSLIKNLPDATENDEAVNLGQMNTKFADYRTSADQDVIDNEIREIASGKSTSYVIDDTITTEYFVANKQRPYKYLIWNNTTQEWEDKTTEVKTTTTYDDINIVNTSFNSNEPQIDLSGYIVANGVFETGQTIYIFQVSYTTPLKRGDNIYVIQTDVPDRWCTGIWGVFRMLETQKVDLTNYAKKNEDNNFSSIQTFTLGLNLYNSSQASMRWKIAEKSNGELAIFRSTDNGTTYYEALLLDATYQTLYPASDNFLSIGSTTKRIKNFYLVGNLTDGTSSDTVAHIVGNISTRTTNTTDTTFSGSLTSNTDYDYSVLTSIAITSLDTKTGDQSPTWLFKFVVGTGLTFTLPTGYSWDGGTPDFSTMVSEQHIVVFMFGKAYLI